MVKRLVISMIGWLTAVAALSQHQGARPLTAPSSAPSGYELEREMPVFLDMLKAELTYPMAWGNSRTRNFRKWRRQARATVLDAMLAPPPRPTDYRTEVVAEEQCEGYRALKLRFNLTGYSRVTAYLLVPDGEGPFPAVVLLHDHGGHYTIGKEKMIRPFDVPQTLLDDADTWARQCYGGRYVGDYLAAHGYAVISVDAIFWGERGRKEGPDGSKDGAVAGNFMMLGRSWSAFMNYEDIYTTEFLASLPEVDERRIACMGFSMGAYRSWMLAALTDRIRAGVSVCWMTNTDTQFSWEYGNERGGFANMLPGLRRYLDYPHIASIACPKPMFFLNGERDKLFPPVGVRAAFAEMRRVWADRSADGHLRTELWDMPHDCGLRVQEAILEFLDKEMKNEE